MAKEMRVFSGPDGVRWGVQVKMPTASNAMVVFLHPSGKTSGNDRYSWHQWLGPESRSVTSRITSDSVMKVLSEDVLSLLFRRSMPITTGSNPLVGSI